MIELYLPELLEKNMYEVIIHEYKIKDTIQEYNVLIFLKS